MLSLRNAGAPLPDAALLFYGAYAADEETLSHRTFGDGSYGLSSSRMAWFRKLYLEDSLPPVAVTHPLVAPLHADLRGLPPLLCCRRSAMFCAPKANYLHNERKKLVSRSMI
jgi:acetyl esterase